jgi:hypothetical protein
MANYQLQIPEIRVVEWVEVDSWSDRVTLLINNYAV